MTFIEYEYYFRTILETEDPEPPYDDEFYLNYTRLNHSRTKRWLKTAELLPETKDALHSLDRDLDWLIITEPWCGDAAHIVPIIELMAMETDRITTSYELRDSEPFSINNYMTNGTSKSIPKLVIRDDEGKDLFVWGPRPAECQAVYDHHREAKSDRETMLTALQNWYNEDKGVKIQQEISEILRNL
jgi:hypothetical protein